MQHLPGLDPDRPVTVHVARDRPLIDARVIATTPVGVTVTDRFGHGHMFVPWTSITHIEQRTTR